MKGIKNHTGESLQQGKVKNVQTKSKRILLVMI